MHLACQKGHNEVVKKIAERSMVLQWIKSSNADDEMKTPLHIACQNGHKEVVETLLELIGDDKLGVTKDGMNPIHVAVKFCFPEIVKLLLSKYPYDVNTAYTEGLTPLHYAAKYCEECPEMITTLLHK